MNGSYKTYVKLTISDDLFLTIVGVIAAVGNGITRFFWNVLFNKTGYRFVMIMNLTIQIIILSIIRFTIYTPAAYMVLIVLLNCCLGGFLVMTPTFLQYVFGQK